ncbi:nitroreductase/quinone reductase family protein [Streptosporangium sp. G11]|uniref:nitroreductase/quinone reductase family protein n=1 Tax=Streptosporangium sp. G11 TaxID=3436926 RepID=UPI003EBCB92D
MQDSARRALALTRSSTACERTADITTTGRRTGRPHRIEIWFYRVGETNYLSGLPGKRGWYANLRADPAFTLHLKHGIHADLPATARPITDPAERHRILSDIIDDLNQPHNPARIAQPTRLEDWENSSPLVEIQFDSSPNHP